ncbi:MAG: CinA family nicotinamide mononucleotide deamidase-related protein [Nitrospinaceae bacterium]|nr:CinA family nicotinamide mononucleotide deamidase-related protein [Nitrospinaceae bacterium]MBT3433693.1 CinA family nicotinamide mononucleotide deamidase-related protein [Nitrospinaceae bacterium]MBT3821479.1 CinA family nicotinamide mononucleotide deamidase-related protein [Nitrospinaceae bacterium]MBT4094361.1 CinA family nicotinamide mononucleotide deamidase-related protein [Nitrospinaceae bacterium]MBT4431765.1 CinA family nicotinamide mononucleotide deamidase-related protein [Nitrospin
MSEPVRAEIVAIGTEMLLGDLIDTNSAFIAQQLKAVGVNMYFKTIVGDNLDRISFAIGQSHDRSQVVITSGGLGPTVDDLTRECVARVMGVELEFRQELYDYIEKYFVRRGFKMTENNRKQAFVPQGATVIENPRGTAPCFYCEDEKGLIIVAPGVPVEMRYIIGERAIPIIQEKFDLGEVIRTRVLKTCGLGESRVDLMIGDLFRESRNPSIGVLAHPGQVDVRITARAENIEKAEEMIDVLDVKVREILGSAIYAVGEVTLDQVVAELLGEQKKTIVVVETNTGGAVLQRLAAWPERVDFLRRGVVAMDPAELARMYDLPLGSEPGGEDFAEALAIKAAEEAGADIGLVVMGPNPPPNIEPEHSRTAPAQGTTHFALSVGGKIKKHDGIFGGNERFIQSRVPMFALDLVRQALVE